MNGVSIVANESNGFAARNRTQDPEFEDEYSSYPTQHLEKTPPSYHQIKHKTDQGEVFRENSPQNNNNMSEKDRELEMNHDSPQGDLNEKMEGGREDCTHCYLCGGLYNRPKILPCLHSFCFRCLQDFERRQQELKPARDKMNGDHDNGSEEDDESEDQDVLPCPKCRRIFRIPEINAGGSGGLNSLPDHIFYSRLASIHRQTSQSQSRGSTSPPTTQNQEVESPLDPPQEFCSVCGADDDLGDGVPPEIARFACLDCGEKLCADCARAHKKQTLSRGHNVLPITDPLVTNKGDAFNLTSISDKNQAVEQLSICGQHPQEKVTLYCSDCSIPICQRCLSSTHRDHAISDVTGVAERGRASLEDGLDRIYGRLEAFHRLKESMAKQQDSFLQQADEANELIRSTEDQIRRQVDEANELIRATADQMRREVEVFEEQLIRETLAIRDNTVQELAKVYEEVDDDFETLGNLRELSEHLLAEGTDADIALLSGRINGRRRHLEATNHDVSVCSVKFRPAPPSKTNPLGKVAILDIDSSDPYIDSPTVISVIQGTESVAGVTLLDGELYIVRDLTPFVDVYNAISFAPIRRLRLDGLRKPSDVTSSSTNQSLYVSDSTGHVYCLQPHGQILIRWQCDGEPNGLNVYPSNGNVLVTCYDSRLLKEFTQDGTHIRTIRLQQDMANPSHTLLVDPDKLIICHGWESGKLHRVCYIDSIGRTSRTYGGSNGSGPGRMDSPARLAVDPVGYVFVLDRNNDRVQLLSPNLVHVRDLLGRGHFGARQPRRMCLDAANGCLYVGMIDGRVIAFRILDG